METKLNPNLLVDLRVVCDAVVDVALVVDDAGAAAEVLEDVPGIGEALLEALATGIPDRMVDARVVGDSLGGFAETLLGLLLPTLLTLGPPASADSDPPS